jgi:hypothetical protein
LLVVATAVAIAALSTVRGGRLLVASGSRAPFTVDYALPHLGETPLRARRSDAETITASAISRTLKRR